MEIISTQEEYVDENVTNPLELSVLEEGRRAIRSRSSVYLSFIASSIPELGFRPTDAYFRLNSRAKKGGCSP